jgi:hypothetical protein
MKGRKIGNLKLEKECGVPKKEVLKKKCNLKQREVRVLKWVSSNVT